MVNEGTETFTILSGTTPIGKPVTVNVTGGAASASYTLPAGTPAGTYTIKAVYSGAPDFAPGSTDASHSLTVAAGRDHGHRRRQRLGPTSASAPGRPPQRHGDQPAGAVNGGDRNLHHPQRQHANRYACRQPRGRQRPGRRLLHAAGRHTRRIPYMLQAAYSGDPDFAPSTTTVPFVVNPATTVTTATNATAVYSPGDQSVPLGAGVSSPSGPVNEGTVTFTVLNGSTQIGSPYHCPRLRRRASAPWRCRRHTGRLLHDRGRLQRRA